MTESVGKSLHLSSTKMILMSWKSGILSSYSLNKEKDGSLKPLPIRRIDTGIGFRKIVLCFYKTLDLITITDCFIQLLERIQDITGIREYSGKFGDEDKEGIDTILADHIRTLTLALADEGRYSKQRR